MDFEKEIWAYSLHNAIEFGKADASKVLPKLFQHGLKKNNIKKVLVEIRKIVEKVNSMKKGEKEKEYEKYEGIVKIRDDEVKGLDELPKSSVEVNGKKVFRLAPFPSGALHIGHAKTYLLNALYAEKYKGKILFVMDDTIGSEEKQLSSDGYELIEGAFEWLGVKYKKPILYKSDRLKIYYKYAEMLMKKGKAYVCNCDVNTMRENRAKGVECKCRGDANGVQMLKWKKMFEAREGSAVLRIKTDMKYPDPAFRDRVLFKISDREHVKVGKAYRVWPSLEMSWAIDDHELGITHIIRGNELMMETKMEKYIWDIFRWKHPVTIHTGLIKLEGVVGKISKSKSRAEIESGEYTGWDDPRTWSVQSLARRGITAEAIRTFIEEIGLNKQDIVVPVEALYAFNRKLLDENAMRHSFVSNPREINVDTKMSLDEIDVPVHPDMTEITRKVKVGKKIMISEIDFEKFNGKEVRLLHLFNVIVREKTKVSGVDVKPIPKINWVVSGLKTRVLMPDGKWVSGFADAGVSALNVEDKIQFERFGFVRFDGVHEGVYEFWFAHK